MAPFLVRIHSTIAHWFHVFYKYIFKVAGVPWTPTRNPTLAGSWQEAIPPPPPRALEARTCAQMDLSSARAQLEVTNLGLEARARKTRASEEPRSREGPFFCRPTKTRGFPTQWWTGRFLILQIPRCKSLRLWFVREGKTLGGPFVLWSFFFVPRQPFSFLLTIRKIKGAGAPDMLNRRWPGFAFIGLGFLVTFHRYFFGRMIISFLRGRMRPAFESLVDIWF